MYGEPVGQPSSRMPSRPFAGQSCAPGLEMIGVPGGSLLVQLLDQQREPGGPVLRDRGLVVERAVAIEVEHAVVEPADVGEAVIDEHAVPRTLCDQPRGLVGEFVAPRARARRVVGEVEHPRAGEEHDVRRDPRARFVRDRPRALDGERVAVDAGDLHVLVADEDIGRLVARIEGGGRRVQPERLAVGDRDRRVGRRDRRGPRRAPRCSGTRE